MNMNTLTHQEKALEVLGVPARAFAVVIAANGRIMNQIIKATRYYEEVGHKYRITVGLRFDDACRNGHESFAITADIQESEGGYWREYMGGCCHDVVAKQFPELAPLVKWHLTSTDGPLHYEANTIYHADAHGPDSAWIYYTAPQGDPLNIGGNKERLLCYERRPKAAAAEGQPGYRVDWDQKTVKVRNLDYARSSAVWPDATDAELLQDPAVLRLALAARLPALLAGFKAAMLGAGFHWPTTA